MHVQLLSRKNRTMSSADPAVAVLLRVVFFCDRKCEYKSNAAM